MHPLQFINQTRSSGIDALGESWGAAWGDVNGDTWPDLWASNHQGADTLYLNQKNGTFVDATQQYFPDVPSGDSHGAIWRDFDNDGDQDLVQLTGSRGGRGQEASYVFVNNGQTLVDQAVSLGLDYPLARGRMPLWFDYDNDGKLDLFFGAIARPNDTASPPTIFRQGKKNFQDVGNLIGFSRPNAEFALISHLGDSQNFNLLVPGPEFTKFQIWDQLLQISQNPRLNFNVPALDIAIADIDGDLTPDLYQVTRTFSENFFQDKPNRFKILLSSQAKQASRLKGVNFHSTGLVTFEIPRLATSEIHIGSTGLHPTSNTFTLSPTQAQLHTLDQGSPKPGLTIGFDPMDQQWWMRWSGGGNLFGRVTGKQIITHLTPINIQSENAAWPDRVLVNTAHGLELQRFPGLTQPSSSTGVTLGDFDNDMDMDIYVVSATSVGNLPNVLYENLGNRQFAAVPNAGGASGTRFGVGDSVTSVDYNLDGFLDLFVTNGGEWSTEGRSILEDGPSELFLNRGNSNHWLQIDLQGQQSNRDGIGSSVWVSAGGMTQLREQNGGSQLRTQNFSRLHFGLGKNRWAEQIKIQWPSGLQQILRSIESNQILLIHEFQGNRGDDDFLGTFRSESLDGRAGDDVLKAGGGNDALRGGKGDDTLIGDGGRDRLMGGAGDDVLFGGADRDRLIGHQGNDSLRGGQGADWFQITAQFQDVDTLVDFTPGVDQLLVKQQQLQTDLPKGVLGPIFFELGLGASDKRDRFIYDPETGALWFDPDGTGPLRQRRLAMLENRVLLQASDIRIN